VYYSHWSSMFGVRRVEIFWGAAYPHRGSSRRSPSPLQVYYRVGVHATARRAKAPMRTCDTLPVAA
jgi:hypothetical protein